MHVYAVLFHANSPWEVWQLMGPVCLVGDSCGILSAGLVGSKAQLCDGTGSRAGWWVTPLTLPTLLETFLENSCPSRIPNFTKNREFQPELQDSV